MLIQFLITPEEITGAARPLGVEYTRMSLVQIIVSGTKVWSLS